MNVSPRSTMGHGRFTFTSSSKTMALYLILKKGASKKSQGRVNNRSNIAIDCQPNRMLDVKIRKQTYLVLLASGLKSD